MRKQVKSLYRIDSPNDEHSPIEVGRKILELYRSDYSITITKACRIFCCNRTWAEKFILPEVQHIFVTHFFGVHIANALRREMSPQEISDFAHKMYFLSKSSLVKYYRLIALAEQKTQMVDITLYRDLSVSYTDLLRERDRHASVHGGGKAEKFKHLENMRNLLTDKGFDLYMDSLSQDKEWIRTALPVLPFDDDDIKFMDTSVAARKYHLNSATSVHNYMVRHGAVRIKFGGKLLWYIPPYTGKWLVPCSYDPERERNSLPLPV